MSYLDSFLVALFAVSLAVGCAQVEPPERPVSVPPTAVWAGGADGGSWIDCSWTTKEPRVEYRCTIFDGYAGDVWSRGTFVLARRAEDGQRFVSVPFPFASVNPTGYDGDVISLERGWFLVPDGEIEYPRSEGGENRVQFELGVEVAEEKE